MQIIVPDISSLDEIKPIQNPLKPFDKDVLDFINDLSKKLLKHKNAKEYPELVALGFWMRASHIKRIEADFVKRAQDKIRVARGVVFHISPTNVDTIFVYSLLLSLLVGNTNILRVSDKKNTQTEILIDLIKETLHSYKTLHNRIFIIRYAHEEEINTKLSMLCDVRVIWGGDTTIQSIRAIPIKPTANELVFADKFSIMAIDAKDTVFDEKFFELLYRDSFTFMQNACSSIRAIAWIDASQEIKERFWDRFSHYVLKQQPDIEPKNIMDKLVAQNSLAIENSTLKIENLNILTRVQLSSLDEIDENKHCGFGLFYEMDIDSLRDIFHFSTKKHQTLILSGFNKEKVTALLKEINPKGIDRVVSVGKAMEFSPVWDGYELLDSFCRIIDVDI